MQRFVGFHDALPVKKGDVLVIPKGTMVRSMHPSRKSYVTKRAQTITVHHTMPGQSVNIMMCVCDRERRHYQDEHAETFARYDELYERYKVSTDTEETARLGNELRSMAIHTSNPTVEWPGTGGYWCGVDINDILEANGLSGPADPCPGSSDTSEAGTPGLSR